MPRQGYQLELQSLRDQTVLLATAVDEAVGRAVDSLLNADQTLARGVIEEDTIVNRKRYRIEEHGIDLIALQQPVASDLRTIMAALSIAVDLERIGDYAVGIARITLLHDGRPLVAALTEIPQMAEQARAMLRRAMDAFVELDVPAARATITEDEELDTLYDSVYRELIGLMIADPTVVDRATWLIWAAHDLERIGDRVTNVCERTIYRATGDLVDAAP